MMSPKSKMHSKASEYYNNKRVKSRPYDHVTSKVREYRLQIRRDHQLRQEIRRQLQNDQKQHLNAEQPLVSDSGYPDHSNDEICQSQDDISDLQSTIAILKADLCKQVQKVADLEVRLDSMRCELARYKMLYERTRTTPRSKAVIRTPRNATGAISAFKTPIQRISSTILNSFRKLSNDSGKDTFNANTLDMSSSMSEISLDMISELQQTFPIISDKKSDCRSNEFLIQTDNEEIRATSKRKSGSRWLICSSCCGSFKKMHATEITFRKNRIHPSMAIGNNGQSKHNTLVIPLVQISADETSNVN